MENLRKTTETNTSNGLNRLLFYGNFIFHSLTFSIPPPTHTPKYLRKLKYKP